jgi:hypothetical protein
VFLATCVFRSLTVDFISVSSMMSNLVAENNNFYIHNTFYLHWDFEILYCYQHWIIIIYN